MRVAVLITAALVALGWLLATADISRFGGDDVAGAAPVEHEGDWRRTTAGWERSAVWEPPPLVKRPPFHPGLLAAFEVWTAVAAVVTASPKRAATIRDAG